MGVNKYISKNEQFKIKGNIAIFYLYIKNFENSYSYLCHVLEDGNK